ncbi:hypothetical protein ABPG75_005108 [Micractinium tetrahymenae]
MAELQLGLEHGWVLTAVVATVLIHHYWMPYHVISARKTMEVFYPHLYAPPGHKHEKRFNCIQRAHQNSLENQPAFLVLLLLAGARFPKSASIAAAVYLLGRIIYFLSYSSGRPSRRHRGAFMHAANLALLGMVGRWAWELLQSAP